MNQITNGNTEANPLTREKVVNFSVAAGSLWVTRHLLLGMLFYFVICQIPGIMVKADLLRCVCISLLLSMAVFIVTMSLALLGSLSYVTYKLFTNAEEFLHDSSSPNLEWMSDKRFKVPIVLMGVVFNSVLLKAFSSFYPNLILVDGWIPAMLAACVIVVTNRALHGLQKNVVKLSLSDEIKAARGRA